MNKRTWHYILPPQCYEITCNKCGGRNLNWSEYEERSWCYDCEIDFIPDDDHNGVFQTPIPMHASYLLGISFDRFNLETQEIEFFNIDVGEWDSIDKMAKYYLSLSNNKVLKSDDVQDPYGFYDLERGSELYGGGYREECIKIRTAALEGKNEL